MGASLDPGLKRLTTFYVKSIEKRDGTVLPGRALNVSNLMLFLLNNGFPRNRIADAFRAHPVLLELAFDELRLEKIVNILRKLGSEQEDVSRIIRAVPQVIALDPARLRKKIRGLQQLGISKSAILKRPIMLTIEDLEEKTRLLGRHGVSKEVFGTVLVKWKGASRLSLEKWKLKLDFVTGKSVAGKNLERLLLKNPGLFKSDNMTMEKSMPLFLQHGLDSKRMAQMVAWHPGSLAAATTLPARETALQCAGVDRNTKSFESALAIAATTRIEIIPNRLDRLSSFGFSTAEAHEMFQKQPRILRVSDEFLKRKMRFLLDCVKLPRKRMVGSPNYMLYSLDKRLRPRFQVAALVMLNGLMDGAAVNWKAVFYSTNAGFKELVAGWNPVAQKIYQLVMGEPLVMGSKQAGETTTTTNSRPLIE